jgi:putative DNA primase/helicase
MQQLKPRTADEAVGRWPGILQALGVDSRYLGKRHGPCPICGGKDRYRFDDKEGRGTWFCSQCGSGDGFKLLQRVYGWDFKHAAKEVDRLVGTIPVGAVTPERSDASKLAALKEVWQGSRAVTKDDPVWRYLNRRLGLEKVPAEIRFHPALKHSDGGKHPAMLARMRYPDGSSASIHRTYLTEDGKKAAVSEVKKFMAAPKSLNTAAVMLGDAGVCLGIAEGIETALAASIRFQMPVWAATNAVLLESWVPLSGVKRVLIAGDNDPSWTGQAAAYALAKRLVRDGFAVEVRIPDAAGKDWADERL